MINTATLMPAALVRVGRYVRMGALTSMLLLVAMAFSACDSGSGSTGTTGSPGQAVVHVTATVNPGKVIPDPQQVLETTAAGKLPNFLGKLDAPIAAMVMPLYQGAMDHMDMFSHVSCYCGCANYQHPHTSLMSCFIKSTAADGSITWNDHSTSCDICEGVAKLTLSELQQGIAPLKIHDDVHAKFKYTGVWTDTPPPTQ